MVDMWRAFWGDLNRPETFARDPYGALTNQGTHALLGGLSVCGVCALWAIIYGEMPYRWPTGVILVGLYAVVIEWWRQGWRRGDSILDAGFVALGVAGPLVSLKEVRHMPAVELEFYEWNFVVWLVCMVTALAVYVAPRIKRYYGGRE